VSHVLSGPWIYLVVALSVLLDVFVPVLPSGVLVVSAVTAGAAHASSSSSGSHSPLDVLALLACAAAASTVGDMAAYGLARRGVGWLERHVTRSRRLTTAQSTLGAVLARGGGALVVLARFAPAGRSVVSLGAGAAHRRAGEFLPWSALAGLAWASYSVGLGYLGGAWLGAGWLGVPMSLLALVAAGAVARYVVRRETAAPLPKAV
jgi:membrane protein DedA with SNARE-associated domain